MTSLTNRQRGIKVWMTKLFDFWRHWRSLSIARILLQRKTTIRVERLENELRYIQGKETGRNLIIFNCKVEALPESEDTIKGRVLNFFSEVAININSEQIISAKRLGLSNPDEPSKVPPVLITLISGWLEEGNISSCSRALQKIQNWGLKWPHPSAEKRDAAGKSYQQNLSSILSTNRVLITLLRSHYSSTYSY